MFNLFQEDSYPHDIPIVIHYPHDTPSIPILSYGEIPRVLSSPDISLNTPCWLAILVCPAADLKTHRIHYMLTWLGYMNGKYVTIYSMDPMGNNIY